MDTDAKLNAQLKSLGKKLFQFRDLVAKIDIPESVPPAPHDRIMWDTIVKKYSSAITVLRQVHAALTPDMYHLAVHPGEKVWRNPTAVPDLLGTPERGEASGNHAIVRSREELRVWNTKLEEANSELEALLEAQSSVNSKGRNSHNTKSGIASSDPSDKVRISRLFSLTSRVRAHEDTNRSTSVS